ncbi:Laminin alpha-2 chain precursor, putative, partial [Gryllus bimaculatus]
MPPTGSLALMAVAVAVVAVAAERGPRVVLVPGEWVVAPAPAHPPPATWIFFWACRPPQWPSVGVQPPPGGGPGGCGCHAAGSEEATCDIVTGQCRCRAGVEGRACDRCRAGHWGLAAGRGRCEPCACDPLGAYGPDCDQRTGQCRCRPGVDGARCDTCLPRHFGFSAAGCR